MRNVLLRAFAGWVLNFEKRGRMSEQIKISLFKSPHLSAVILILATIRVHRCSYLRYFNILKTIHKIKIDTKLNNPEKINRMHCADATQRPHLAPHILHNGKCMMIQSIINLNNIKTFSHNQTPPQSNNSQNAKQSAHRTAQQFSNKSRRPRLYLLFS